jgi:hypothetical protein
VAKLPDSQHVAVLNVARDAFMGAFTMVSWVAAATAVAMAIVTAVLLRRL